MSCVWVSQPFGVINYTVLHSVLHCTVLYCTVLYCTVLYCTVLYCTVLHCTVLYCTHKSHIETECALRAAMTETIEQHVTHAHVNVYTYTNYCLSFLLFYDTMCLLSALPSSSYSQILFLTFFTYRQTITGRRSRNLKFEFLPGDLATYWDAEGVDRTVRIKEKLSTFRAV